MGKSSWSRARPTPGDVGRPAGPESSKAGRCRRHFWADLRLWPKLGRTLGGSLPPIFGRSWVGVLCACKAAARLGRPGITTDGVVKWVGKRGLSKEPVHTEPSFDNPFDGPFRRRIHRGSGTRHPRRVAEGHWDLDFRIPHIKLRKLGQVSPRSDEGSDIHDGHCAPWSDVEESWPRLRNLMWGKRKSRSKQPSAAAKRSGPISCIKSPKEGVVKRGDLDDLERIENPPIPTLCGHTRGPRRPRLADHGKVWLMSPQAGRGGFGVRLGVPRPPASPTPTRAARLLAKLVPHRGPALCGDQGDLHDHDRLDAHVAVAQLLPSRHGTGHGHVCVHRACHVCEIPQQNYWQLEVGNASCCYAMSSAHSRPSIMEGLLSLRTPTASRIEIVSTKYNVGFNPKSATPFRRRRSLSGRKRRRGGCVICIARLKESESAVRGRAGDEGMRTSKEAGTSNQDAFDVGSCDKSFAARRAKTSVLNLLRCFCTANLP